MDPISVGASSLSMHIRNDKEEQKDDAFKEIITSCRSLSSYEDIGLKIAFPQIYSSIIAASFHIVIGIALAFSAVLVPQLESPDSDIPCESKTLTSLVASCIVLMIPFGSIIAGFSMEKLGRINTIKLAAIPSILGWILISTSTNIYQVLAGRMLTGIACAVGSSPAIVYITEVARPDLRGSLISSGPTIASLGMVIAYASGAYFSWRVVSWMSIFCTLIPVVLIQLFVPESPVYLVTKGRIEDAAASLKFLYKNYPQPDHTTESLADMHLNTLIREKENRHMEKMKVGSNQSNSKWAGFLKPTGYKPMIILFFLFLIQQFSGIYITLFFAVTFLQDIGAGGIDAFTASIFVGLVRFIMSLLNAWLLKRFKRRLLVMVSSLCMAVCMFISGAVTIWIREGAEELNWVPIVCLLLFVCSSMIGLLTIPWTMTAELFPNEIRGIAHSIAFSMANILMFFAVQSYRTLLDVLGGPHAVQWFFAVVSICGFFFALIFLPETHGKKLSEIEAYFQPKEKVPVKNRKDPRDIYSVSANSKESEVMLKKKEEFA